MILLKFHSCLLIFFIIPFLNIFAQTDSYQGYQTSVPFVTTCDTGFYLDIAVFKCLPCPTTAQQKSGDVTKCECRSIDYYYEVNQGGGSVRCSLCNASYVRSSDGFGCVIPQNASLCASNTSNVVISEAEIDGSLYSGVLSSSDQPRYGRTTCLNCTTGTWPDIDGQRCTPCASVTPRRDATLTSITCCRATETYDGICLTNLVTSVTAFNSQNSFQTPTISQFINRHFRAAYYLCTMNIQTGTTLTPRTLLSNVTACQVLANIAVMQFYYDDDDYAFNLYQSDIWSPNSSPWPTGGYRPVVPFLRYPSSYYQQISSSTYSWIPSTYAHNDLIQLKLAKYSPEGKYLGLVNAYDSYLQLCGGGYTLGKAAFTFGTQFKQSCFIRADALWDLNLYETAFFDPYIVFTQSDADQMLPTPVVITNYRAILSSTSTNSYPNQNSDESAWVYHRRFFLIDHVSGVNTNNVLQAIHYAKSIKIITTLTSGVSYLQPPVIVIEYAESSSSDIGKNTLFEITFESQYRMDLSTHIRDIWIAVGVLSALGILLAFIQTSVWQSRSGKEIIDLITIGKLFIFIFNILSTIFFIVMAGVSLWWLIFYKRQDTIYYVLPTSNQQTTFTALICVAFVLKIFDILHLIFRQANMDIFFMDWEKPKTGNLNTVSVWRTYFVANEFHEIQTFRRINLTLQLFFVLFLLKVINLENVATAQPSVNLFPTSSDYTPDYNSILRVGIAFSMWIATALVQYLFYILFYQRLVEDRILNFIDLCSVSNISVFILVDNLYGYYIHGLSPHGTTDVNMRDMIMNLERESKQMSGSRGLEAKSNEQTFIIRIDRRLRMEYERLLFMYQNRILMRGRKKGDENESEILMTSYRHLNEFLCAFVNHSLPTYHYTIRERFLWEKLLNYEFYYTNNNFQAAQSESVFFVDSEKSFKRATFSGHDHSLFMWNMITFLFIDYFAHNYVLAAIVTYVLNFIAEKMRLSLGRRNLSTKTLIPKNFLI